jgi:hypothetical protein
MENEKSTLDNIIDDAQEYFNAKQQLAMLKFAEKSSQAASAATSGILLAGLFLLVVLFASIALGFALSAYFGSPVMGFLGVAGLYLLILLLMYINREKWIITPMSNTIIKSFFNKDNDGKN